MLLEKLSENFASEVISHIKSWMKLSDAEDIKFHFYRMKLFQTITGEDTAKKRLLVLLDRVATKNKTKITELMKDKGLGETAAKFVLAAVIIALNKEYEKILDHELDKIEADSRSLGLRMIKLKEKLSHH